MGMLMTIGEQLLNDHIICASLNLLFRRSDLSPSQEFNI
jgi:hypothetical protein